MKKKKKLLEVYAFNTCYTRGYILPGVEDDKAASLGSVEGGILHAKRARAAICRNTKFQILLEIGL